MRMKSHKPCELLIYSKCFWKPVILALVLTIVALSTYIVVNAKPKFDKNVGIDKAEEENENPPLDSKFVDQNDKAVQDLELPTDPPLLPLKEDLDMLRVATHPRYQQEEEITTIQPTEPEFVPTPTAPPKVLVTRIAKKLKPKKQKIKQAIAEKWPVEFTWCPSGDDSSLNPIDCQALFSGEEKAVESFKDWKTGCELSDGEISEISKNCTDLDRNFRFNLDFDFETQYADYPLAYVLVVEKNAEQVIRLLKSIYRKQNLYCVTYDDHSTEEFKRSVTNLASCFDNVLTPEKHIPINWGGFSILEANVNCMRLLNDRDHDWRYVQMLSWNDYPLKTNEETVEIFRILNGSQDSELKDGEPYRYIRYYKEDRRDQKREYLVKNVPPGNLYIFKGSLATSLSREFVNFVFTNDVALNYYEYSKSMLIPEEQFWSTLIHNLHIRPPGGFPGICKHYFWYKQKRKKPWISRHQMWKEVKDPCEGQWTHKSCVYGVGDLWSLKTRPELMAHKVYADFQPAAMYCLEQLHFNRTYFGRSAEDKLDYKFYEQLPAVKFHNMADKSKFNCVV